MSCEFFRVSSNQNSCDSFRLGTTAEYDGVWICLNPNKQGMFCEHEDVFRKGEKLTFPDLDFKCRICGCTDFNIEKRNVVSLEIVSCMGCGIMFNVKFMRKKPIGNETEPSNKRNLEIL